MIKPPFLKKGDKIGIVAPAGKIDPEIVRKAKDILTSWGLEVVLGKHVLSSHFYFAAKDEDRREDFQHMLDDPEIKAILCARGGYGVTRIIDQLNFEVFKKNPKWIIGFSDITALHSHIHTNFGVQSLHAPMAKGLGEKNLAENLRKTLFGEQPEYTWKGNEENRKGKAKGILTGGNLSLLCNLIGTPSDIKTNGKILFIEEIGENLYRIDRMMVQLMRAGKLEGLAGLLIGGFTDLPDEAQEFGRGYRKIILNAVKAFDYPVAFDFPAGHQDENYTLVMGAEVSLEIGGNCLLKF